MLHTKVVMMNGVCKTSGDACIQEVTNKLCGHVVIHDHVVAH